MLKNLVLTKFWSKMSGDQAQHIFQTFYWGVLFSALSREIQNFTMEVAEGAARDAILEVTLGKKKKKSHSVQDSVHLCPARTTPTQYQRGLVRWEVLTNTLALLIPLHREHLETQKSVCLVRTGNVHIPSKCRFSKAVLLGQLKENKLPTLSYCMAFCYTEITNIMKNSILAD